MLPTDFTDQTYSYTPFPQFVNNFCDILHYVIVVSH